MKITIVGTGEVGLRWAQSLTANSSYEVSVTDPAPPAAAAAWAQQSKVTIRPEISGWIEGQDIVLVCVPGFVLPAVAASLRRFLGTGATIVDLTTAAAQAKREAAADAQSVGISYIDIAITGAVALSGVRTPLLYAGAENEAVAELLAAVGAPVRVLPNSSPGDAVTVKLLRSVIMKGLEALAVESLPAARAYGVLDQLCTVLGDVDQSPFVDLLKSMVTTHPAHAVRRHAEVLEAAAQLEKIGHPSVLTGQVAARYAKTAERTKTGGPAGPSFEAALDWLDTQAMNSPTSANPAPAPAHA
jgi:3-hydroxyisobutyrate dehydrogenase